MPYMVTTDHCTPSLNTDMYSHGSHEESPVIDPEVEAIPPGCPFTYTETPDITPDRGTSDTHGHAGNPDSTSDAQPHIDTGWIDDTQMTGVHTAVDQMQEEEVDSSSYRNISMWVGSENIVIEGTRMSELIVAYIAETDMRYRCLRCDYIS